MAHEHVQEYEAGFWPNMDICFFDFYGITDLILPICDVSHNMVG